MANHTKPTQEELDEEIRKAQELIDQEDSEPDPEPEEDEEEVEEEELPNLDDDEDEEETPDEEEEDEEEEDETPDPKPEPKKDPDKKEEDVDYEQKFKESSREAQVIALSKKQLEEQIDEAQNMPEPTESELRAEFAEWESLSDFEKRMAKDNFHNKRINSKIREIRNQQKQAQAKITERETEIESFVIQPDISKRFPNLKGKEEDFKKFATKPTRLTLDLEDLVKLFLFDQPVKTVIKHKGKMFETGSGGANGKPKPSDGKLTPGQGEQLRKRDYKKYVEYLRAGKIRNE